MIFGGGTKSGNAQILEMGKIRWKPEIREKRDLGQKPRGTSYSAKWDIRKNRLHTQSHISVHIPSHIEVHIRSQNAHIRSHTEAYSRSQIGNSTQNHIKPMLFQYYCTA